MLSFKQDQRLKKFSRGVIYRLMRKALVPLLLLSVIVLVFSLAQASIIPASAQDEPERVMWITVDFTSHEWWLVRWSDNTIACQLDLDHDGFPTAMEIQNTCGYTLYEAWYDTPPCTAAEDGLDSSSCSGFYLQKSSSQEGQTEIEVELPKPEVWISIKGNLIESTENKWAGDPKIVLTGEEKLANEQIVRIFGTFDGQGFDCEGAVCELPLTATGDYGVTFTFQGESSFGDKTEEYTAYLRVLPWGETSEQTGIPQRTGYYVDIISPQWRGQQNCTCAAIWQAFPPIEGAPAWLDTPNNPSDLSSSLSLHFLAALLIQRGEVDASDCPGGGLDYPTAANLCGVEKAAEALSAWQNQFDEEIMTTSLETGIPAQLLKNIFARESQLWPGIYHDIEEVGFGQLTSEGADTALLWNPEFYRQFCPLVLLESTCRKGYGTLTASQQSLLRGALVQKVNATCPECPMGIDLTQANFSVQIFGETLVANCSQVNRMIYNLTQQSSGKLSSLTDLWRFTLINYNAGPGCLWTAMSRTWKAGDSLDWVHVAANLEPSCRGAVDYVYDITEYDSARIPVFSTMIPTATTIPTRTPRPLRPTSTPRYTYTPSGSITPTGTVTNTPTPTSTPTPTRTPSGGW